MTTITFSSLAVFASLACGVAEAHGGFTWFNNDAAGWQSAASAYTTCSFTEFPHNTYITDQYASLGVLFTNPGPNVVHAGDFQGFPLDGFGIDGNGGIELTFSEPAFAVSAHGPDLWMLKAYLGQSLVYASPWHLPTAGGFAGFVSTTPFDRVQFVGINGGSIDDIYVDNIYFSTVPSPPAIAALTIGALARGRRRR